MNASGVEKFATESEVLNFLLKSVGPGVPGSGALAGLSAPVNTDCARQIMVNSLVVSAKIDSEKPQVFDIKAGSDLYWTSPKESFGTEDYPVLSPPFPVFGMFYRAPKYANGDEGRQPWFFGEYVAFSVFASRTRAGGWILIIGVSVDMSTSIPASAVAGFSKAILTLEINPDGTRGEGKVACSRSEAGVFWNCQLDCFCYCLCLINAKNTNLDPKTLDAKLQKARIRRGKPPGITEWKVLKLPSHASRPGSEKGDGSPVSLHVCRGHFKTYTAEKPLLGRHVGTYWFPHHVRGSSEVGTIEKVYAL